MTLRCIPVILVILDHSIVFRMIIPEVVLIQLSSSGWAQSCSKHVQDSNKHTIEETVRQVCCLPELYEDGRSEKYKMQSVFLFLFFVTAQLPLVGQNLLINNTSRSHSVGLLWMSDQPYAEISVWQHTTFTRSIPAPGGIRTPQSQHAWGRRSTP